MHGRRETIRGRGTTMPVRRGLRAALAAALACGLIAFGVPSTSPSASAAPLIAVGVHRATVAQGQPGNIEPPGDRPGHAAPVPAAAPAQQVSQTNGTLGRWVVAALLTFIIVVWITLIAVVVRVRLGTDTRQDRSLRGRRSPDARTVRDDRC